MKAKKKGFDTQLASGCIKIKPLVCMGYQRSTNQMDINGNTYLVKGNVRRIEGLGGVEGGCQKEGV